MMTFKRTKTVYVGEEYELPYSASDCHKNFGKPDYFRLDDETEIDYWSFKHEHVRITFSTMLGKGLYVTIKLWGPKSKEWNDATNDSIAIAISEAFMEGKVKILAPFFKY